MTPTFYYIDMLVMRRLSLKINLVLVAACLPLGIATRSNVAFLEKYLPKNVWKFSEEPGKYF